MDPVEPLNIDIIRLDRTCIACPSQWDAYDNENNYYYIRYRHGWLSVNKNAIIENCIFETQVGDGLDGYMTDTEMLAKIGFRVPFEMYNNLDRYGWMEDK